ncbi:MAG: hypothetical protein ACAH11_10635, partial [Sphingomonas sp.]
MHHLRLIAFLVALALPLGIPAAASQGSIDDDWAGVKTCAALDAFKRKHPGANRFSGQYGEKARRLGCTRPATPRTERPRAAPRPTPRPSPRPEPPKPPPYQPAPQVTQPLQPLIVRLATSGGDASDFASALAMVRPGGTIRVSPGRYRVWGQVNKAVRIEGYDFKRSSTFLEGRLVVSGGGRLMIKGLTMRGTQKGNVVTALAPFSCNNCQIETSYGGWGADEAIIKVADSGTITLDYSDVRMTAPCASYCTNIWLTENAGVGSRIDYSSLTFTSYGVVMRGGELRIFDTSFNG